MKKIMLISAFACTLAASATQYSCLSIITAAKGLGKWEPLKAWIVNAGFKDEWDKCAYVADTYPQYVAITNALVSSGVLSADEITAILAASVDPAIPDDMISRVVAAECATAQGRVKWHGPIVSNVIDTNALTRTQIHEDGFIYVKQFSSVEAIPVEVRLSQAERKAEAERRALEREAEEQARREARIVELQTNMDALAADLAVRKQYPLDLAKMLLLHELNQLLGTVTVDAVITPGK